MSVYADMMDRLVLLVHSPDKNIKARLRDRTRLELSFLPEAYQSYSDWTLSNQLAGVSKLLWVGRRRASFMARREALGERFADEVEVATSREQQELFDKRARIEATGTSTNRWITATTVGWTHWNVELAARATRTLREYEFCAEAVSVFPRLLADYQTKHSQLLQEYHEKVRPESFRNPP